MWGIEPSELDQEAEKLDREVDRLAAKLLRDGQAENELEAARLARQEIVRKRRFARTDK